MKQSSRMNWCSLFRFHRLINDHTYFIEFIFSVKDGFVCDRTRFVRGAALRASFKLQIRWMYFSKFNGNINLNNELMRIDATRGDAIQVNGLFAAIIKLHSGASNRYRFRIIGHELLQTAETSFHTSLTRNWCADFFTASRVPLRATLKFTTTASKRFNPRFRFFSFPFFYLWCRTLFSSENRTDS